MADFKPSESPVEKHHFTVGVLFCKNFTFFHLHWLIQQPTLVVLIKLQPLPLIHWWYFWKRFSTLNLWWFWNASRSVSAIAALTCFPAEWRTWNPSRASGFSNVIICRAYYRLSRISKLYLKKGRVDVWTSGTFSIISALNLMLKMTLKVQRRTV